MVGKIELSYWKINGYLLVIVSWLLCWWVFCWMTVDCRLITPSSSSIIFSIELKSVICMGLIEISRTARNWPQLFKCSFSKRKKFQTNRLFWIDSSSSSYGWNDWWLESSGYLKTSRNPKQVVTNSLYVSPLNPMSYRRTSQINLRMKFSIIAK